MQESSLTISVFFFKQKTAYEIMPSLVGSEMCIRDSHHGLSSFNKKNKKNPPADG